MGQGQGARLQGLQGLQATGELEATEAILEVELFADAPHRGLAAGEVFLGEDGSDAIEGSVEGEGAPDLGLAVHDRPMSRTDEGDLSSARLLPHYCTTASEQSSA